MEKNAGALHDLESIEKKGSPSITLLCDTIPIILTLPIRDVD